MSADSGHHGTKPNTGSDSDEDRDDRMECQDQDSGILRYLKDNTEFEFFEDPQNDTRSMFTYDLQRIARDAMTYSAQRRTAKLPAELRLKIMQACVFYNTPTIESVFSLAKLREKAAGLFDGEHMKFLDKAVYDVLQEGAEQAFLEHVMFTVRSDIDYPDWDPYHTLPDSLLAQMRYVHIRVCVPPSRDEYGPKIRELLKAWDFMKLRLTSLRACVLTLDLRTMGIFSHMASGDDTAHVIRDHDTQFSPELLSTQCSKDVILGTILAGILDGFAEKGLAARCLARVVHRQLDATGDTNGVKRRMRTSYGPLVLVRAVESGLQDGSMGTRLLAQMYQLARTGEVLEC